MEEGTEVQGSRRTARDVHANNKLMHCDNVGSCFWDRLSCNPRPPIRNHPASQRKGR